mgnify:FL=1
MKILVVDDSKAMRMIVIRTLRQAGYSKHEMTEAQNGIEALKVIEASPPDLVLSDWNMPDMSGIELLKALRQSGSQIKFGFITSENSEEMRMRAVEAGASFLIGKPFNTEIVQKILGSFLDVDDR